MNNDKLLSIIILTYNEEIHIKRCLDNVSKFCQNIYIVDSYSADKTTEIAKQYTNKIFTGNFTSFSEKLNWAIDNLPIETTWSMRIDADEIATEDFQKRIFGQLKAVESSVEGIYIRRQLWFMNQWMKYGDMYPTYSMRIWKTGKVKCENRFLDEHMILKNGNSKIFDLDIIDNPLTSISDWINKHNKYSDLEVKSHLNNLNDTKIKPNFFGKQEERKRWLKEKLFYQIPLFVRPFFYFLYRYIAKFGFLDGRKGFIWNVLHAFWYRFLVDVKIYEIEQKAKELNISVKDVAKKIYGVDL